MKRHIFSKCILTQNTCLDYVQKNKAQVTMNNTASMLCKEGKNANLLYKSENWQE